MLYVNRPPLTILAADRQSSAKYNKLISHTTVPFKILKVRYDILNIDENGISNTISVHRATPVCRQVRRRLFRSKKHRRQALTLHEDRQDEFLIHKIVGHHQTADRLLYLVRWYGLEAKDDTFKPHPTYHVTLSHTTRAVRNDIQASQPG